MQLSSQERVSWTSILGVQEEQKAKAEQSSTHSTIDNDQSVLSEQLSNARLGNYTIPPFSPIPQPLPDTLINMFSLSPLKRSVEQPGQLSHNL